MTMPLSDGPLAKAAKAYSEDDSRFNWRKQDNRKRGVKLKDGSKRVVSPNEYDDLRARGKLDASNPRLRGDLATEPGPGQPGYDKKPKWEEEEHPRVEGGGWGGKANPKGGEFKTKPESEKKENEGGGGKQPSLEGIENQADIKRFGQSLKPGGTTPEGDKLKDIQRHLGVEQTGKNDDATKQAIRAFQTKYGLQVDGIAGQQTRGTLAALIKVRRDRKVSKMGIPITDREAIEKKELAYHQAKGTAGGPLRHLLAYYSKKPHPFRACVRDNRKRFGPRAEAVCARLKDIMLGTEKWRHQFKGKQGYVGKSFSLFDGEYEDTAEGVEIIELTDDEWKMVNDVATEMFGGVTKADDDPEVTAVESDPEETAVPDVPTDDLEFAVTKADAEKRRTIGVLYQPDMIDAHGEFVTADELEDAVCNYVKAGNFEIRKQHRRNEVAGHVVGIIAWPHEVELDLMMPTVEKATLTTADLPATGVKKRRTKLPPGTVFVAVEWNRENWADVKKGKLTGLSMGGRALRVRGASPVPKAEMSGDAGVGIGAAGRGHLAGSEGPQHTASNTERDGMAMIGKDAFLHELSEGPIRETVEDEADAAKLDFSPTGVAHDHEVENVVYRPDEAVTYDDVERYIDGAQTAVDWLRLQARGGNTAAQNLLRDIGNSPQRV